MEMISVEEYREQMSAIGRQLTEYVHSLREEGLHGETKEEYERRVYAKAMAGQKLTPDEMNYLARNNPLLYQKVLRAQIMRKALENQLQSSNSKQEAEEIYMAAVSSISEKDPDREMILAAYQQAYKEYRQSTQYAGLPDTREEAKEKKSGLNMEFRINSNGYQETYVMEAEEDRFIKVV